MASRKKATSGGTKTGPAVAVETPADTPATPVKRTGSKKRARVAKKKPPKAKTPARPVKKPAKKSARPRRYTPAERAKILAAAKREGLSGPVAAKKFGISQLTFYTWRKKAGTSRGRRPGPPARQTSGNFSEQLREAVHARVREMLPEIIEREIGIALSGRLGSRRRSS